MTSPGGGARMDPDRVRAGATKFDVAADQLEQAHHELEQQLHAQGPCWGGDEAGQAFAEDYQPGADGMVRSIQSLTEALRSLREQVQQAAEATQARDRGNARDLGGI